MKITCNKNELTNALQIVARAVASKPQTPILSGIYLRAEGTTLELQATNYEIGLVARIEAEIEEAGELTVGGRYFQEVVRKLPGENVKLACAADEKIVHIESAMAKFTLLSMNAAEFPTIQPLKGNLDFAIKDNILRDLIKKTVFACSNDEARPVFTGCSLEVTENKVTMAATNTHRLSVKSETFDQSIGNIKVIIPSRILQELLHNMSSDIPTDVKISCSYNQISFSFDNLYMTSRLIEGQFPNYRGVIPPEFATHVKADTASFAAAVDRISLIARAGVYNTIKLELPATRSTSPRTTRRSATPRSTSPLRSTARTSPSPSTRSTSSTSSRTSTARPAASASTSLSPLLPSRKRTTTALSTS